MESQETSPRKITAGDAAPPQAPGSLNAEVLATSIALDWPGVPDTDGDLVGYRLYRRLTTDPPETWSALGALQPVGTGMYTDSTVSSGNTYIYEVRSIDTAANESAPNPTVEAEYPPPGGGSGGGGGCQENCMPGQGELLLPPCRGEDSVGTAFAAGSGSIFGSKSFCLGWERAVALATPISGEPEWRIVFYHVDHLGTPRVLTDEMGAVISKHALYPFGEEVPAPAGTDWTIANSTNTHWFTGHERDAALGTDSLPARLYSPNTARFRQSDPSLLNVELARSTTWQGYTYVNDRPMIAFDPLGLAELLMRGLDLGLKKCPAPVIGMPYNAFHTLFRYKDGSTSAFQAKGGGTFSPERPDVASAEDYTVLRGDLDDKVLRFAETQTKPDFEGKYATVLRVHNCNSYTTAAVGLHDYLVSEARKMLAKCKDGDKDECRRLQNRCAHGSAPEDVCKQYEVDKSSGVLPVHSQMPRLLPGGRF